MSVKASKDKDSILADTKELLKILIPAIQTMPKIERHDGAAQDMKRAAFDMIHHFTIAYNCPDVRELNIQQMFGDYGRLIACFEILLTQKANTQPMGGGVYEKYKEAERLNRKYSLNLKKKKNYEKSKFTENRDRRHQG